MRGKSLVSAVLFAAVLGACSSSDTGGAVQSPPASSPPATTSGTTVDMTDDLAFAPATITVKAGTEVTWKTVGQAPHNVMTDDPALKDSLKSETISTDQTYSFTFASPGTVEYYCSIHGKNVMAGKVVVEA